MLINLGVLEKYYEEGWIVKQTHPTLPLTIWNYSRSAQFEKHWDEITLMCRGLITENITGKIVARPLKKFFNREELKDEDIPNESFEVTEKMDGSLMIVFDYNKVWMIASRGSFTSDQAIWGKKILDRSNTKYGLIPGWTYCMELIVPQNRIVINYGEVEKLVVLCAINTKTGIEGSIKEMTSEGWEIVKKYNGITDFSSIKKFIKDDQEGFVIRFKSGFRMKIKGDEYVRLHRILTQVTSYTIWEYLRLCGELPNELLERIPDEFDGWLKTQVKNLKTAFKTIEDDVFLLIEDLKEKHNGEIPIKKEYAEWVKLQTRRYQPILFKIYDGKVYNDIIWKYIKPTFEKPFRVTDDE